MRDLREILNPKSVELIGNSEVKEEVGIGKPEVFHSVQRNLGMFSGEVYITDLSKDEVVGGELQVYVLPKEELVEAMERGVSSGCEGVIVLSSAKGYEEEVLEIVSKEGVRLLGPNSVMGVINTENKLNTTFPEEISPKPGSISVVSQSGGVGATLLERILSRDLGISKFIWLGNKLDIDEVDALEYLGEDASTREIGVYLEDTKRGRELMQVVEDLAREKRVFFLIGGSSEAGARAAQTHTSALAGNYKIFRSAIEQSQGIVLDTLDELFDVLYVSQMCPIPRRKEVDIVTNVGGPGILASDLLNSLGVPLSRDRENPRDLIADADYKRYLNEIRGDVLTLVIVGFESTTFSQRDLDNLIDCLRGKPVVLLLLGNFESRRDVIYFQSMTRACLGIRNFLRWFLAKNSGNS